jgi:hypothetical protein
MLYPRNILLSLHRSAIILTSLLAQFPETGDIKKRKMVEMSPKDIKASVGALLLMEKRDIP